MAEPCGARRVLLISFAPLLFLFQETETTHRCGHLFNAFFCTGTSTHYPWWNAKTRSFSLDRCGTLLLFTLLSLDFRLLLAHRVTKFSGLMIDQVLAKHSAGKTSREVLRDCPVQTFAISFMRFVLRERRFQYLRRRIHSWHADFSFDGEQSAWIFFEIGDRNDRR